MYNYRNVFLAYLCSCGSALHLSLEMKIPERSSLPRMWNGGEKKDELKLLLFITTHMKEQHQEAFRYCWPTKSMLAPKLARQSDVLIFTTKRPEEEVVAQLWPLKNVRIHTYENPGYAEGAMLAVEEAIENNWFEGYDWVIRINPDVFIRSEAWLLQTMNDDAVDGIFVDCLDKSCTQHCNQSVAQTDFFALRPRMLPKVKPPRTGGAEESFTQMVQDTIQKGRDRWLPDTFHEANPNGGRPVCRVSGPNSLVVHDHTYVAQCIAEGKAAGNEAPKKFFDEHLGPNPINPAEEHF